MDVPLMTVHSGLCTDHLNSLYIYIYIYILLQRLESENEEEPGV